MRLETGLRQDLHLLVLFQPLILHFRFQVLADLKVLKLLFKDSFYQSLVDVLEVNSLSHSLVSLDTVRRENFQNVFVLDNDHLFLVNVKRIFIVDAVFSFAKPFWSVFAHFSELCVSKRRG